MMLFIKRIFASCFLLFTLWSSGLYFFVTQIPTKQPAAIEQADAIIVLTGGAGRIGLGVDLLIERKAPQLFVSGANQEVTYDDLVRMTPHSQREYVRKSSGNRILLGTNAQNTIGNAQETRDWLKGKNYNRIILITSHYHMPRSLSEFTHLMPTLKITPVAVIPKNINGGFWWLEKKHRPMVMSEYYKYLISKLRHWAINNIFADIT